MCKIKLLDHAKWYGWKIEEGRITYTTSFWKAEFSIEFSSEEVLVSYLQHYASGYGVDEVCSLISSHIKSEHEGMDFSWSEVTTEEREIVDRCKALLFEHTLDKLGFPTIEESIGLLREFLLTRDDDGEIFVPPIEPEDDVLWPATIYFGRWGGTTDTGSISYGDMEHYDVEEEYIPYSIAIPWDGKEASYFASLRAAGKTLLKDK